MKPYSISLKLLAAGYGKAGQGPGGSRILLARRNPETISRTKGKGERSCDGSFQIQDCSGKEEISSELVLMI